MVQNLLKYNYVALLIEVAVLCNDTNKIKINCNPA
jgi:hypothetical protein